jgi:hypothetical protein
MTDRQTDRHLYSHKEHINIQKTLYVGDLFKAKGRYQEATFTLQYDTLELPGCWCCHMLYMPTLFNINTTLYHVCSILIQIY